MSNFLSRALRRLRRSSRRSELCAETRQDYQERFQQTLGEWLLHHQKDIVFKQCSWMGVQTLKNPLDAWIYQEIIHQVKPDVIVEIGSFAGGSTLYFAHLLDLLGKGIVLSVDIDRSRFDAKHDRIVAITGDSASDEVVKEVSRICGGKTVLVFHDGDHSRTQVLKDLRAYAPLVSTGSYFIVEDGIVDLFEAGDGLGWPKDGPLAAVEEFIAENDQFVIDSDRERYILTYNPKGFLRRVK